MSGYYYLSNPYNGSEEERNQRAKIAAETCGVLLRRGLHVWSPIVHNHAMVNIVEFSLEERRSLILDFDFSLLKSAKAMILLEINGWKESFGVKAEIELCHQLSIPIKYLNLIDLVSAKDQSQYLRDSPRS
jgi:hypothetical protein